MHNAVLRGHAENQRLARATVSKLRAPRWTREAQATNERRACWICGLIGAKTSKKHTLQEPACRKYFMHGLGHSLGLQGARYRRLPPSRVAATAGFATVEPGIYIPAEGFAVRLETDILLTDNGPIDLATEIPIEPDAIEAAMRTGAALGLANKLPRGKRVDSAPFRSLTRPNVAAARRLLVSLPHRSQPGKPALSRSAMQAKMGKESPRLQYGELSVDAIGTVATKTPWDCGSSESSICPRSRNHHMSHASRRATQDAQATVR